MNECAANANAPGVLDKNTALEQCVSVNAKVIAMIAISRAQTPDEIIKVQIESVG